MLHIPRFTLLAIVLSSCASRSPAPTAWNDVPAVTDQREQEARERAEMARAVDRFYEANPVLRGREKCVARALGTLSEKTWENLGRAGYSFCVPPPPPLEQQTGWIKVFTGDNDRSTFVDSARIEAREGNQVSFWELVEVFDDSVDFLLSRTVVECDRRLTASVHMAAIVSGRYGVNSSMPIEWRSVLPNTQAEAVLTTVCAARAELVKPTARVRPEVRPSPQPVRQNAAANKPSI